MSLTSNRARRWPTLSALTGLAVALALATTSCTGEDGPDADRARPASSEPAPADPTVSVGSTAVPPAATEPVPSEDFATARRRLEPVVARAQVPPAVADCLYHDAAIAPEVTEGVDADDPETWAPVLDVVARCNQVVVAAPAFAEEQQRAAGGSLTEEQLACLRDGYAGLSPEELQAITDNALAPGPDATDPTEVVAIIERCGVDRGR